ncbi:MAG: hypothetical protein M3174_06845 [Actinomycetota bacterium]|nr:hypothetical protein [Actinomycetota bacterium]
MQTKDQRVATSVDPATTGVQAGAFGFLCALAVGALLVVGAKLQVSDLGAGASPLSIFETIVLAGLGSLGAPVQLGGADVMVLPLGAIAFVVCGIASAARRASLDVSRGETEPRLASHLRVVAATAATLAITCALAAWLFRIGDVGVDPFGAAVAGSLWGAVGALLAMVPPPGWAFRGFVLGRAEESGRPAWLVAGARAALWVVLCSLVALAVLAFARFLFRTSSPLAAVGWLIHGIAFAPNLAAAGAAVALGGSVEAGFGAIAATTAAPEYSLFDWAGGPTPAFAWLLPLLPLACVVAAGIRLSTIQAGRTKVVPILARLAGASFVFATTLSLLALAGEARAGVVENEGFALLAADPIEVFVLALGWAAVGLPLGWGLGLIVRRRSKKRETR